MKTIAEEAGTIPRIRDLDVSVAGIQSGRVSKESQFIFRYADADLPPTAAVSLAMPVRLASYNDGALHPPFAANLPEGWLLDHLRTRYAKRFERMDDMALLALTGHNQIGRVSFAAPQFASPTSPDKIGRDELLRGTASDEMFAFLVERFAEYGVSGVQPKIALPLDAIATSTQLQDRATVWASGYIVKSAGTMYPDLAINEFICMSAAKAAGICVPIFHLSIDRTLFIIERFDEVGGTRLGFEDMAALMRKYPGAKYEGSYEQIATAINLYCGSNAPESLTRLFEYVAFSVLVRNGDAHLKNFGLVYREPWDTDAPPTLAPLYDVVTTHVYEDVGIATGRIVRDDTLALKLGKTKSYVGARDRLFAFGTSVCGVARPADVLDRIVAALEKTLREHSDLISGSAVARRIEECWTNSVDSTG